MPSLSRRRFLLSSVAAMALLPEIARARSYPGGAGLPFEPYAAAPPVPVSPGAWLFFNADEARAVEAIVDRLIPADELSVGGREAGCAVFIDRQLAGPFGDSRRLYMRPPFQNGTPQQGDQSATPPAGRYRQGLAALDAACRAAHDGRAFADLAAQEQDAVLHEMEAGKLDLAGGVDPAAFFDLLIQNTSEGFFADPVYGGNRDMVSWKMVGFPGARYDYRDYVEKHNVTYPFPPVSIAGRMDWR